MHEVFLPIIIAIAVIGLALSVTELAWPFSVMERLGRTGTWIHHEDMDPPEQRPDENPNDPAIPQRRLRGRG